MFAAPLTQRFPRASISLGLLLLVAVCLLGLLRLAPPVLADSTPYVGGPIPGDCAAMIANDQTVYAFRFSAVDNATTGALQADTSYYVKVRFSPTTIPASTLNRGFTWNPDSNTWANGQGDWASFPQVTTDADGNIPVSPWLYVKFDDDTIASGSTYYVIVSLSLGQAGGTHNNNPSNPLNTPFAVTVFDPKNAGYWVHCGPSTGVSGGTAVDLFDPAFPSTAVASQVTEPNLCDDDSNSVVDDEVFGFAPSPGTGGFRVGVPIVPSGQDGHSFKAYLGGALWPTGSAAFTGATPDVDLALGAADHTAPGSPVGLAVAARAGAAHLSWTAPADGDLAGYDIYRWIDPAPGSGYSGDAVRVKTVPASATTCDDTGLTNGTTYQYLVRAVDTSTNIGPRSAQVSAVPDATPPGPVTGLHTTSLTSSSVALAWTNPGDADFAGVKVLRKQDSAPTGPSDAGAEVVATLAAPSAAVADSAVTAGSHYYYAVYAFDTAQNYAAAASLDVTPPLTSLTLQTSASIVAWGGKATLTGVLTGVTGPLYGQPVTLESSVAGGPWNPWSPDVPPILGTNRYTINVPATQATQFRLHYAGDGGENPETWSTVVTVTPRVQLSTPSSPATVKHRKSFRIAGTLAPRLTGARVVKILCYLKVRTVWVLKKTVSATATAATSGTTQSKYSATTSLPTKGQWKLLASFAATSRFAATTSGARTVKVK